MMTRIHIFGASGSGTTTLAKTLAKTVGSPHYDTDTYFWMPTTPPFQTIRERAERQTLLRQDLTSHEHWILSGSLCGWGDFAIPLFEMVVFLWLPPAIRMQRLKQREMLRYGPHIDDPTHPGHHEHVTFLEWAAAYDTGGMDTRSTVRHEAWLATVLCPVIRIEGDHTIQEKLSLVMRSMQ